MMIGALMGSMTNVAYVALISLALATPSPASVADGRGDGASPLSEPQATSAAIPSIFQGFWIRAGERCGSASRMTINADTIETRFSDGVVTQLRRGSHDREIHVHVRFGQAPEPWETDQHWTLSKDLTVLVIDSVDGFQALHRC